ncbi:MAG: hypothetical protein ACLFVJ_09660 [Persicimonas sp.]
MSNPSRTSNPLAPSSGALLLAVLVAATCLFTGRDAAAQACCTATGAGELSVVGRCYDGVAAAQLSYERAWGSYDVEGEYHSMSDAEIDDFILTLGAGQRVLTRSLQVHASVPLRMQYRRFGDADGDMATRLGDAAFALRWTALEDKMDGIDFDKFDSLVPFLDAYIALKVPSGRAPEDSESATGADITGDGAWQALVGTKISKFITSSHVLAVQLDYIHGFARDIDHGGAQPIDFDPGEEFSARLSWLQIHDLFWSWGAFAKGQWATDASQDGEVVDGSATERFRVGAHITHAISFPLWEVTLSGSVDTWWDHAGQNLPYVGPSGAVTLRRNWY